MTIRCPMISCARSTARLDTMGGRKTCLSIGLEMATQTRPAERAARRRLPANQIKSKNSDRPAPADDNEPAIFVLKLSAAAVGSSFEPEQQQVLVGALMISERPKRAANLIAQSDHDLGWAQTQIETSSRPPDSSLCRPSGRLGPREAEAGR